MEFSLVSTVFNEAKRLKVTIQELENQTLLPSEIIITDAGSNDGTIEILEDWKNTSTIPIIIIIAPKCNVAQGRNIAIRKSSYGIIASTDFGCRFHKDWLKSIIEPFIQDSKTMVVGGSFTVIEEEQITISAKSAYIMSNGYRTDVNSKWFLPSSRSIAYRKSVFDDIGGYCEWLTLAADDTVFAKELLSKNYKIHLVDKPYVFWGRHKQFISFKKEAFRYGLGDGEARLGFVGKMKNLIYVFLRISFLVSSSFLIFNLLSGIQPSLFLIGLCIFSIVGFRPYYGAIFSPWLKMHSSKYGVKVLFACIYLFETTHFNYYKGYLKGYYFSDEKTKVGAKKLAARLSLK